LIITTRSNTSLFIEQYSTDDTPGGTSQDGEINLTTLNVLFNPNVECDLFVNNSIMYITRGAGSSEEVWSIDDHGETLTLEQTIPVGLINGAASYPECNDFEFTFTDPRCKPLVLFGVGQNAGVSLPLLVARSNFQTNQPGNYTQINLGGYVLPSSFGSEMYYYQGITHTYDFDTDTGMMWVKVRSNNSLTTIYEFTINDLDFNCTFVRTIQVPILTLGGVGVIDETHLLLSSGSTTNISNNPNLRCSLILVDITNNTITPATDIVQLAQLPSVTVVVNNVPEQWFLAIRGSIQVMPNNKIVLGCVPRNTLAGNIDTHWAQYTYNPAGPSATLDYTFTDDTAMKAATGAFPWNGQVLLWNRVASSVTNSAIGLSGVQFTAPNTFTFPVFPPFNWGGNIDLLLSNDGERFALSYSTAYPTVLAISTCNFVNLP
jgi:hypothetical protein